VVCAGARFGHERTLTTIADLRVEELTAAGMSDGPVNRAGFETYIETQLAPTLLPGDVMIGRSQKAFDGILHRK